MTGGIERANRILIPLLFVLLLFAVARAVTLPGAAQGLAYLFTPDLGALTNYRTWLEALTQSAWSTGAGWGLILCYSIYVRERDDVVSNAATIGLGNNVASLLAAMAILPAAFAILPQGEATAALAAGNTGLTFIWIPQVFARMPAGGVFLPLFFLAMFCAALSSLIAMVELGTRVLLDAGVTRGRAVRLVVAAAVVCGAPSAVSMAVFENQDWVWGLALMISGLFIAVATIRYGVERFGEELVNTHPAGRRVGPVWAWISEVPRAGRVRGDVRLVDVPGGDGVRPGGLVESAARVQRRHVRAAMGRRAGGPGRVQPAPRRPERGGPCYAWGLTRVRAPATGAR